MAGRLKAAGAGSWQAERDEGTHGMGPGDCGREVDIAAEAGSWLAEWDDGAGRTGSCGD